MDDWGGGACIGVYVGGAVSCLYMGHLVDDVGGLRGEVQEAAVPACVACEWGVRLRLLR